MDLDETPDEYFGYDARLASFQISKPATKRKSNTKGKAAKALAWPHQHLDPDSVSHTTWGGLQCWVLTRIIVCSSRFLLRSYTRVSRQHRLLSLFQKNRRMGGWRQSLRGTSEALSTLWLGNRRGNRDGSGGLLSGRPGTTADGGGAKGHVRRKMAS